MKVIPQYKVIGPYDYDRIIYNQSCDYRRYFFGSAATIQN